MGKMMLKPIGKIHNHQGEMQIVLDKSYLPAMEGLEGFGHLQVFNLQTPHGRFLSCGVNLLRYSRPYFCV